MRIILSRTDSIGDVVLTLPMAGVLKQYFPDAYIIFLGRNYTRPVIEACVHVNEFAEWNPTSALPEMGQDVLASLKADFIIHVFPVKEICIAAKQVRIPVRIATARRTYTWFTCNKLLSIPRKSSSLHEAQLNLKLLKPLGITRDFSHQEIGLLYGLDTHSDPPASWAEFSSVNQPLTHAGEGEKLKLILHPRSKGSAREWGLGNYSKLISLLPAERYEIFITGTADEGASMSHFLEQQHDRVNDLTGKLSLTELMALITGSDALVAASTGPLHLAAALGIRAIGLYAPMRPIFPTRWAPLGKNASFLVMDKKCSDCRNGGVCACIRDIRPEEVADRLGR